MNNRLFYFLLRANGGKRLALMKGRIAYWDNLKLILIFCVVWGHVILPVNAIDYIGKEIHCLFFFIYIFHMPAFVFVSGFFSKKYAHPTTDPAGYVSRIIGYLTLYLLFVSVCSIKDYLMNGIFAIDFIHVESAPWYLLAMAIWLMILPLIARLGINGLLLAFALSVISPCYSGYSNFLSLGRVISWLPFFIAGYLFKAEWIAVIKGKTVFKALAFAVILANIFIVYEYVGLFDRYYILVFATQPYIVIGQKLINCMVLKALLLALSSSMILSIMILCPSKRSAFTNLGSKTLGIYIGHSLVRDIFFRAGIYTPFEHNVIVFIAFSIVLSMILIIIFSERHFNEIINFPFRISRIIFQKVKMEQIRK